MSEPKVPIVYNATGATIAEAYVRLVAYLEEQGRADLIGAICVCPEIYRHEGAHRRAWAADDFKPQPYGKRIPEQVSDPQLALKDTFAGVSG